MRFRTYVDGDEEMLSDIFNRSYTGLRRTPDSWKWRYVLSPNFDPNGVIILEDHDSALGYVVGTPRKARFLDERLNLVLGDDLCVVPSIRGRGYGKRLLQKLIEYTRDRKAIYVGYEGENLAHEISLKLGRIVVDDFYVLSREPSEGVVSPPTRRLEQPKTDFERIVSYLNNVSEKKIGSPVWTKEEYEWRYLRFSNCDAAHLAAETEEEQMRFHVALTSHKADESYPQSRFYSVSEAVGSFAPALAGMLDPACRTIVMCSRNESQRFLSLGFKRTGIGTVSVSNFSGYSLDSCVGKSWYIYPESSVGEP